LGLHWILCNCFVCESLFLIWKLYDNAAVYINLLILNSLNIVRSRCSLVACAISCIWTEWNRCICIHWLSYIVPRNLTCYLAVLMNFSSLSLVSLHAVFLGGSMVQYVCNFVCVCHTNYLWLIQVFHGVAEPAELGVQCKTLGLVAPDSATWWKMMVFSPLFCQYGCFPRFHPSFWYATTLGGDRWLFKGILRLESLECCTCISRIIWSFGCNSKIHRPSPRFSLSLVTHLRGISAQTCCGRPMWLWRRFLGAIWGNVSLGGPDDSRMITSYSVSKNILLRWFLLKPFGFTKKHRSSYISYYLSHTYLWHACLTRWGLKSQLSLTKAAKDGASISQTPDTMIDYMNEQCPISWEYGIFNRWLPAHVSWGCHKHSQTTFRCSWILSIN